jgi:hypothetical protein
VTQPGKKWSAALLGLGVVGCAPAVWDKPGATDTALRSDLAACHKGQYLVAQRGRQVLPTSPGTDLGRAGNDPLPSDAGMQGQYINECLNAKGWKQVSR